MLMNDIARMNIKKYRKMKKMSQKEFAEALDVTHSSVSSWEIGKNSIDLNRLNQICQVLDVPLFEMIFEPQESAAFKLSKEMSAIIESLDKRPEIKEILKICMESKYNDIIVATKLLQVLQTR